MIKNCLRIFSPQKTSVIYLLCKRASKKTCQKAKYLAPKEDDEVDGWSSGRNMHQETNNSTHQLSWHPDQPI